MDASCILVHLQLEHSYVWFMLPSHATNNLASYNRNMFTYIDVCIRTRVCMYNFVLNLLLIYFVLLNFQF